MRITFKDLSYYNYLAIAGYGIEAFCLEEENSPHLHFYLDPLYKFLVRRGKKFLKIKASHMKEGDILYGNKKFEILRIDGDPLVEPPFTLRFDKRPKRFYNFKKYLEDYFKELGEGEDAYTSQKANDLLHKHHIAFIEFIYNGLFIKSDTGETLYQPGTILIDNVDHYDKSFDLEKDLDFEDDLDYVEAL